jgi:hypothetical protein
VVNKKAAHTVETTIDGNGFGYEEPAHIIWNIPDQKMPHSMRGRSRKPVGKIGGKTSD